MVRRLVLSLTVAFGLWAEDSRIANAIRVGRYNTAQKLLEAGADPNGRDSRNITPLIWAAANGQINLAAALLEKGALHQNGLQAGALNRQIAIMDFLLSHGADPGLPRAANA